MIDTGATRCCLREDYFKKLPKASLTHLRNYRIRSASRKDLHTLGKTTCPLIVGDKTYQVEFIVCRNLIKPAILGLDFLRQNRIGTTWTPNGTFALQRGEELLVESIEVCFGDTMPKISAYKHYTIPARSIVIVNAKANMQLQDQGRVFEVTATPGFNYKHPSLATLPILHKTDLETRENVPYLLINLSTEDEEIEKGEEMANVKLCHYQLQEKDKESLSEEEIGFIGEEKVFEQYDLINEAEEVEKKFITSPAQVESQRRVKLQDAQVSKENKENFRSLCYEYADIFSKSSEDIGHTPLLTMDIETGDSPPICQKPYSLPLKHVEWVTKELEILEKAGVISRSVSPWASAIVIVPKKSEPGEPPRRRMCVDYRVLNSLLPPVNRAHSKAQGILTLVSLPKIDEIYAQLQGSKVYSAIDMRSGYFHLGLSKDAKPKTAFVLGGPHGAKYEFNRCPFGLSQAPAYFQRLVHEVLKGITFAFGYLDDILIFSPDNETHLKHLRIVFQRLREADLKLKVSKCNFFKKHIQYLGHLVSGEGIEPLPEKLEAVKEMPPPTTPKEVRQFLGLVGYYRKFVPKFSDIARPLTNLTKQDVPYEWTEKCQQTFEFLKEMLLKDPILKYPDPSKPYTLFTDASKYAWACVLTQEYTHNFDGKERKILHPITYVSGLFRRSQLNWATLTKEAYAIYMSVRKLDHYIQDAEVVVRSDHLPLKTFLHKNTLNTKVNNWAIDITSRCTIRFEYIKGIKNTLADTMSRLIKITPEIILDPEPQDKNLDMIFLKSYNPWKLPLIILKKLKME